MPAVPSSGRRDCLLGQFTAFNVFAYNRTLDLTFSALEFLLWSDVFSCVFAIPKVPPTRNKNFQARGASIKRSRAWRQNKTSVLTRCKKANGIALVTAVHNNKKKWVKKSYWLLRGGCILPRKMPPSRYSSFRCGSLLAFVAYRLLFQLTTRHVGNTGDRNLHSLGRLQWKWMFFLYLCQLLLSSFIKLLQ